MIIDYVILSNQNRVSYMVSSANLIKARDARLHASTLTWRRPLHSSTARGWSVAPPVTVVRFSHVRSLDLFSPLINIHNRSYDKRKDTKENKETKGKLLRYLTTYTLFVQRLISATSVVRWLRSTRSDNQIVNSHTRMIKWELKRQMNKPEE